MIDFTNRVRGLLPRGNFARSVTTLAGGTALGQLLVVVAAPLLTRLYTPEDFGVLAVYASILGIVAVLASLRYELAIPLPDDDETAANLLALSLGIVVIMSVLTGFGTWLLADQVVTWTAIPGLRPYLWLLPAGVLMAGSYQVFSYWATRKSRFGLLSYTKTIQAAGQVCIQLLGGVAGSGALALIAGSISGRFMGTGALYRGAPVPLKAIDARKVFAVARRYSNFPIYNSWAALVTVIGTQAPPLLLASFFTVGIAGLFSLTGRILSLPAIFIGQAVAQVFYPLAAREVRDVTRSRALVSQTATALFMISFPVFTAITVIGPDLFAFVFGSEWREAGSFARYLAPWLLVQFVSSPLSTFVLAKEKQRLALLFSVYEAGLRLVAMLLGIFLISPLGAVALYSAAGVFISTVYIRLILRLASSSMTEWMTGMKGYLLQAISLVVVMAVIEHLSIPEIVVPTVLLATAAFTLWTVKRQAAKLGSTNGSSDG
jgi:lipopolysaccharide exporter